MTFYPIRRRGTRAIRSFLGSTPSVLRKCPCFTYTFPSSEVYRSSFDGRGKSAVRPNPGSQGTYAKGEAFASHSVGKESAGESRSLAANVALKQRVDFWQQSHPHCPPLSLRQRRHSRFQWWKPVQEVTARIGLQSSRIVDDVRSVIVLAFAIVSPATESAPDKDLRRTDSATCDLD